LQTPWRALFVGSGPLDSRLRAWGRRHGERVHVQGGISHDEVPAYLNAMDVLCAPSQTTVRWREQFGRMLIEAFSCGVPVIAANSGEIPHVVGDAGVTVDEREPAAWAHAIDDVLAHADRRAELSRRGRDRAVTTFSWPVVARQHLQFFSELTR
jgi:glycosyltransferase involved in cell wall biosynthesis